MASSMCGPSNALYSLQKHTAADRSLQQEHLQSPASSSRASQSSFRAQTTHSNKQLDTEFSQFSAGVLQQDVRAHVPPLSHAPRLDGWASDFQRLHIGAPPLLQQQQQQQQAQGWAAASWHEEFMLLQQPVSRAAEPVLRGPVTGMGMYSGGFGQGLQMGGGMYMGGNIQSGGVARQEDVMEQFDDAAFERAFEDARVQLEERQDVQVREELAEVVREVVEEAKEAKDKEHDSDELARTAAQLLDSLSGNHSQKFQDSTFLALMRRLRDREVKVEGDKMVEAVQTPGSGSTEHVRVG